MRYLNGIFIALGVAALAGCNKDDGSNADPIEYVYVNEQINLNNIQYAPLRHDKGTVAIPGGVRGILIVRQNASLYYAFERNCTYRPADSCATVSLAPSMLYLEDPCCTSQFTFNGQVQVGPAVRPLVRYNTTLNGSMLYITN